MLHYRDQGLHIIRGASPYRLYVLQMIKRIFYPSFLGVHWIGRLFSISLLGPAYDWTKVFLFVPCGCSAQQECVPIGSMSCTGLDKCVPSRFHGQPLIGRVFFFSFHGVPYDQINVFPIVSRWCTITIMIALLCLKKLMINNTFNFLLSGGTFSLSFLETALDCMNGLSIVFKR